MTPTEQQAMDTAMRAAYFTHRYWLAVEAAAEMCMDGTFSVKHQNSKNLETFAEMSQALSKEVVELLG